MQKQNSTINQNHGLKTQPHPDEQIPGHSQDSGYYKNLANKYLSLCNSFTEGFCVIQYVMNEEDEPVDSIFREVNPAFGNHTGWQNPEGKSSVEFDPGISRKWLKHYRQLRGGQGSIEFLDFSERSGRWFKGSAFIFGEPGEHMAAMILSDVTRKKQAEEEYEKNRDALSSSEARFRSIVETANEGIVLVDEKMNITYGNQKLSEMSGYSPDEFMGRSVFEFLKNKERNRFKRILIKINQQQRNNFDISIQRKSGQTVKVLVNASIIRGDNGKNQGYLALITDISARYDIEKDLKKTKKKLEIALNNGKIGTWEWNIRTNEVVWDSRMHEMFNLKPGTFGGTFSHFEECVHEEDVHHIRDAIRQTLLDGKPYEVVYRTSPVNGKSHYIASKALLMRSNKGNPLCLSGVAFDITDMKEGAEKVLIKTNEELLRSNSDLRQFAAVASHDLQEPLRMIASYTQLLKQKYSASLDEDAIDYINYAVDGSKRMYEMINGLLAYSRVNSRGVEFKPVDMNRVLDRVKENLKFALGSANAVIMSDKLPVIIADENQIIQLLQNLIENSVKFSKTTPRIEISCEKAGSNFVFSLKDNGIGIENQYFERIFRIFQKLHTREVYSGSGIGLAICRRIIERHSGKIWVKSEEGKGSTFCFTIPVR